MPYVKPQFPIGVPDAGVTVALEGTRYVERYMIYPTQTGTMAGNTSISEDPGTTPVGAVYELESLGGFTLGANTFTVFGKALTAQQALTPCLIVARWDGSSFYTQIYTDWSTSNNVTTAQLLADSVTTAKILDANVTWAKLQALARGSTLRGSSANVVEALALASGRFPLGDGTDVTAGVMSADATLAGTGALTIANDAITTAKILNEAVTLAKQADLPQGNIIRGSSTDRPEAYDVAAIGAGAIVMTDGTDVLAQQMSGDATLSGAGILNIVAGLNTYVARVQIPSASVLTANTIPINLLPAWGAGLITRPIACFNTLTYAGVAYATNGQVNLRHKTATDPCMISSNSFLFGTVTHSALMVENQINAVTDTQFIANQPLLWEVNAGDPTLGTSDVICYLIFEIVTA